MVVYATAGILEDNLKASTFYRIAAVLLLLFAFGHTYGFRQSDPAWGVDTLLAAMHSIRFTVQGFSRTYWDLFVGPGSLCLCFFYSRQYWPGNSVAFRHRLWRSCTAQRGRSPFVTASSPS